MTNITRFDPHSIEGQFSLQMASYLAQTYRPQSVHLCTQDPEVAIAAALRLPWARNGLTIDHEESREAVSSALGLRFKSGDDLEHDVTLVLFSRQRYTVPPKARHLVMVERNALSYKSILYPGQILDDVISQLRWFRRSYRIEQRIGMFGPRFLVNWAISLAAGTRFAATHFLLGQQAMDHLFTTSPLWWIGYLIVLSGRCHN